MNDHPAPGRRGSLPGLALVIGLLAFFIADALSADNPGGGHPRPPGSELAASASPVIAFFVAAGAMVLLVLLLVAVKALTYWRYGVEPEPEAADLVRPWNIRRRPPPGRFSLMPGMPRPTSWPDQQFLRAVDEFVAAMEADGEWSHQAVEQKVLAIARGDRTEREVAYVELSTRTTGSSSERQVDKFIKATRWATTSQLQYLKELVEIRRRLR